MSFSPSQMKLTTILITSIFLKIVSSDILQNPDFELPPSNWSQNSTSTFFTLNENSSIPGWAFEGAVEYATSGANLSLPGNGHAILLGQDGKINQTFTATGVEVPYLLTFTLAIGGQNCNVNASLVISAPDSSAQFSLTREYGNEPWVVYGHQLGSWGDGEIINLVFQSQGVDADLNSTCWPVVDNLLLNTIGSVTQGNGNLLPNGGFESGPAFPDLSNEGVLLDSEPSLVESALQQWTVTGTVKYINTKNYYIPEGKSAVEMISGVSAGVHTARALSQGSDYHLEFILGDANDSCSGDFTVGVEAGTTFQNFTIHSNGTGSGEKYSLMFKGVGPSLTPISFQSYTTRRREDGVFCGPVVDAVVLHASRGRRIYMEGAFLISLLLVAFLKLSELI